MTDEKLERLRRTLGELERVVQLRLRANAHSERSAPLFGLLDGILRRLGLRR